MRSFLGIYMSLVFMAANAATSYMTTGFASPETIEADTINSIQRTSDLQRMVACSISVKSHALIEKRDNGNWFERWTVDRCGKSETYKVLYRPRPDGRLDMFTLME